MIRTCSCHRRAFRTPRHGRFVRFAATNEKQTIEFEDLLKVIETVDQSDVIEMELKGKNFAMSVRKQEALRAAEPVYVQVPAYAGGAPAPAPAAYAAPAAAPAPPAPAASPAAAAPKAEESDSLLPGGVEIVAPMAGTVYRKPAPGEPLFVKEGDRVAVGQSICIIEAMKLMNEIEADVSGTVVKFVAQDAQIIEAGQVICIVDAN